MKRVLKVGGQFVITDWCHDYFTCSVLDFFLRRFNHAHFRAYRTSECENLLRGAGLTRVEVERYKIDWFWGVMTARGHRGLGG